MRIKIIVPCLLGVIVLVTPLYLNNQESVQYEEINKIIKEVKTPTAHLIRYVKEDTEYLKNVTTEEVKPVSKVTSLVSEALGLEESYAVSNYSYLYGTQLVDPVSLNIGIVPSIPYTYDSKLSSSSVYIETLLYDGWEISGIYRDNTYVDYYLSKDSLNSRVIVLKDSMKIFYKTKGKSPDPLTYISERKDGK